MYKLLTKKIECHCGHLLGKSDVFVILEWSGSKYKSNVKTEIASTIAIFEEKGMTLVPDNLPDNYILKVQVWETPKFRPHVMIGETEIDIVSLSESPSIEKSFTSDLKDSKKINIGAKVIINLVMEPKVHSHTVDNQDLMSVLKLLVNKQVSMNSGK